MYEHHNILNTSIFSLDGTKCICRLVDIIDGDTFEVILKYKEDFFRFRVRLHGIDTEELKSKDEEKKQSALKAHEKVVELCCGTEISTDRKDIRNYLIDNVVLLTIHCKHFDSFGRILADVFFDDHSLSAYLLNNKLAKID